MSEKNPVLIQVLAKIPGLSYFANFYWDVIDTADERANSYCTMRNPDTTTVVVLSYLLFVLTLGPRFMASRETPSFIQSALLVYNVMVILMNGFLAAALTSHVVSSGYDVVCEPVVSTSNDAEWVMRLLYGFYISKIVELVDTCFLVLKKKSTQLTFLHVYHHSTIIAATWIGVKFVPGGTTAIIAMVNSWVHVFMYIYYELMAANVKISEKYKRFMTIVQISQFCFTLIICSLAMWVRDCGYPKWVLWWLFLYMMSFLILFGNFFIETYKCGKPTTTATKHQNKSKLKTKARQQAKVRQSKSKHLTKPRHLNGTSRLNGEYSPLEAYNSWKDSVRNSSTPITKKPSRSLSDDRVIIFTSQLRPEIQEINKNMQNSSSSHLERRCR